MTAFEDYLQTEFPNRSVLLTNALTGYDGDPNSPSAPDIIQNSPLGTWFREETAAKWWRKTETVWEEQGGGPGGSSQVKASATDTTPGYLDSKLTAGTGIGLELLTPAGDESYRISSKTITTEPISMVIDPVSGVSPPAGTIVTNQAQYDALGAPLRYAQDALNILPPILGDYVKVRLMAGNHWAPPGATRLLWSFGRSLKISGGPFSVVDPVVGSTIRGTVVFYGDTSVYTASQAGTYTAPRSISCPTGTWAANELQGKFVWLLTGTGAGSKLPIRSNTATTIELGTTISAGSGTFEIRQNDSYLLPTTNGTDTVVPIFLLAGAGLQGRTSFMDLHLCSPAKYDALLTYAPAGVIFTRCNIYARSAVTYAMTLAGLTTFSACQIVIDGAYPAWVSGGYGNQTDISRCMVRGKYSATGVGYPGLFSCYYNGYMTTSDSVFEPTDGTFTKGLLGNANGTLHTRGSTVLDGLGTAQGINVGGGSEAAGSVFRVESSLNISNCTTALRIRRGTLSDSATTLSGSGNGTIFDVAEGAEFKCRRTGIGITGTNYANIDGEVFASSNFANDGDKVVGQYGSSLEVTA